MMTEDEEGRTVAIKSIEQTAELVKRVAERKRRKNANAAILAEAREKIRERRQFVPKQIKSSARTCS